MNLTSRIVGIDPGSRNTGYGILDRIDHRLKYVASGVISPDTKFSLDQKLEVIFEKLSEVLQTYAPKTASVEKIFHSVNPKSSLILGHARGAALLSLRLKGLQIFEYAPNEVKSAVVGVGKAQKSQVAAMVRVLLNLQGKQKLKEDEADALALAICHANQADFARYARKEHSTG